MENEEVTLVNVSMDLILSNGIFSMGTTAMTFNNTPSDLEESRNILGEMVIRELVCVIITNSVMFPKNYYQTRPEPKGRVELEPRVEPKDILVVNRVLFWITKMWFQFSSFDENYDQKYDFWFDLGSGYLH